MANNSNHGKDTQSCRHTLERRKKSRIRETATLSNDADLVEPIQIWRGCVIYLKKKGKKENAVKKFGGSPKKMGGMV